MLKGFDIETAPLNEFEEYTLLPAIVNTLSGRKGKRYAIKNSRLCRWFNDNGYSVNEARVRKIINHIRIKGLVPNLIATSNGYYVAESKQELIDYVDSLKGREAAIRAVRNAIEQQAGI